MNIFEVLEKRNTEIDEDFRNYRQTGIGFSATIIALSLLIMHWVGPTPEGIAQFISLGNSCLAIISAVSLQWAHYRGYVSRVKSMSGKRQLINANSWFALADRAANLSALALLAAFSAAVTLWY